MAHSAGLGTLLRECRETKGLSLDDLSRDTRISLRLLLALEEDRFKDLPAPIFVRGFIRAYCAVVGEPPERALAFYDSASGATRGPSAVPRGAAVVQAPSRRSRLGLGGLRARLGVAGALVVIGGAAYLFATSAASRSTETLTAAPAPPPTATVGPVAGAMPAATPVAAPVPTPIPAPTPVPAPAPGKRAPLAAAPVPAPTAPPPVVASASRPVEARSHVLVARAHESTWVSVRGADGVSSQELLEPGSVREWQSPGRFTVTVGNAGGLTLELDGVALPPLGAHGQVVRDVRLPREPTP